MTEFAPPESVDYFFGALDQPRPAVRREPEPARARARVPAALAADAPPAAVAAVAAQVAALSGNLAAGRVAGRGESVDAFFGQAPPAGPRAGEASALLPAAARTAAVAGVPAADAAASPASPGDAAAPGTAGPPEAGAPAVPVSPASRHASRTAVPPAGDAALGPDDIRARTAAAAAALSHPRAPSPAANARGFAAAGRSIQTRGDVRVRRAAASPGQIAGRPPFPAHAPRRQDPGPIPAQMEAIRLKSGRPLPPAALPAMPPSPRGTVPNLAGPILTAEELRAISVGPRAIEALTPDPDERARLIGIRERLTRGETATAPAPEPAAGSTPAPTLTAVPVEDEPVAGIQLDPQQRAMFTRVVGELQRDIPALSKDILRSIRTRHRLYPNGILEREFSTLGEDTLPAIQTLVTEQTGALGDALGLVPDDIQAAVGQRRTELDTLRQQAAHATAVGGGQASATASAAASHTLTAARHSASATTRAAAADHAATGTRHRPTVRDRVEHAIDDIRHSISTARAVYDTQQRNRERALANAVRRQVAAIRLTQTGDELAIQHAGGPDAGPSAARVRRWADAQVAALQEGDTSALKRLTDAAHTATDTYKSELDGAGGVAFGALRDWAGRQTTASEEWWTALDTNLASWATDARARAGQWQLERGEEARLALAQDLAAVRHIMDLQHAHDSAAMHDYIASLDAESRTVLSALSASAQRGAPDLTGALAAGLQERIRASQQTTLEDQLQSRLLALPATPETLEGMKNLVHVTEPGFNVVQRVADIHASVTRWRGFDEQAIFRALEGLTSLGAELLRREYLHEHDQTLDEALHGHGHAGWLDADEFETAQQMLRGDSEAAVNGAVGAINSAITGLGTDKEAIKRILRGLNDEQRSLAVRRYRARYGEGLDEAIRGEWISSSQQDEIVALSESRIRDADSIALGRTVETHYTDGGEGGGGGGGGERYATIDRSDAQAVFAQVRSEVEAEGRGHNWTTAQIEAEITLRNREVEQQFNVRFSDQWWAHADAPGTSAMRSAFELSGGAGRDLLNAVADNDLQRMDVARLRLEDEGIYAEDAAINAVFRDQNSRSLTEVERDLGPFLHMQTEAQLAEEARQGKFPSEADRLNRRMELERQSAGELSRLADERTKSRMSALGVSYQTEAHRSLEAMVEANMSGASRDEARVRVAQLGVVSNYQRVRFSIEGAGTDLPMLRSALAAMNPEERRAAIARWPIEHDGESLEDAIHGDTSGRDEGDMIDLFRHGSPRTVDEAVAAARRRFDRDRDSSTFIGEDLTEDEVRTARRAVTQAEADLAQLHRTDLSPAERERASAHYETSLETANLSIEVQRAAVDAWSDTLSFAAALVAGIVVGILTGGTATPVVAALLGSLAATVASIATKALVKGGAYGLEELETDLAVGAVDALVATLTAGLGSVLLGEATRGAATAERTGMNQVLGEMGRAARQGRAASLLSRGPRAGLLARAVERTGLFEGVDIAARPMWQRVALRGAAHVVESGVQALPSSFAASVLDERAWRRPGGIRGIVDNTFAGAAQNVEFGMVMMAAHAGVGHAIAAFHERPPAPGRPLANDVLDRLGSPRERLADFREWRAQNPEGTYRDFYNERQTRAIEAQRASAATARHVRAARGELLSGLPPHERAAYADVPILSATSGELHRLVGEAPGDAHVVVRDGQAVVVVREGAPPGAVAPLIGEIRDRVFAHSGGMTLEGALPPHLREDVQVRRDPSLTSDTVKVVPIPREGGPITGVEVVVGPRARPIDVTLHAEAVERVQRWTGRVGEARALLARVADRLGFDVEGPHDRARMEAAEEIRKLGPIIEERIRRIAAVADDPVAAARVEAESLHLLAQQERARRILSGELEAEPRGYIAAEGLPEHPAPAAAPPPPDPVREINRLRNETLALDGELRDARAVRDIIDREVDSARDNIMGQLATLAERTPHYRPLAELDLKNPGDLQVLRDQVERWPPEHPLRNALAQLDERATTQPERLRAAEQHVADLEELRAAAQADIAHYESQAKMFNGVPLSPALPEPRAGWGYTPAMLDGKTLAVRMSHINGYRAELRLANEIQVNRGEIVIVYGDKTGTHGSDVISVHPTTGEVILWDSKYVGSGEAHEPSTTYTDGPLENAMREALAEVLASDRIPQHIKDIAAANVRRGDFTAITVSSDATSIHTYDPTTFRAGKPVP